MTNINNISQEEFERIEAYILNKMPAVERKRFEAGLKADSEMNKKFLEMKDILDGIEETALRNKLQQYHEELQNDKTRNFKKDARFNWRPLLAAASILLIVVVSMVLLNGDKNDRLFAQFFNPDPGLVTAMSSHSDNYEFERGMVDYKTGNYEAALERWQPLLTKRPDSDTLNYFFGSAYMIKRQAGEAIPYFKKVTQNVQSQFLNDAYWYLALAYLKQDKTTDAVKALSHTNHPKKEELLNKLYDE